jgi:hypothetical protein
VLGLLPPGPAWEAAGITGTIQNQYWSSFANLIGYTYGRLCAFVNEFFCATVNESMDQWVAEYGLDDPCDPYGFNLCVKVAAESVTTCPEFVAISALSGWVITCTDQYIDPIAGCSMAGCTQLGPTPVYNPMGSALGTGDECLCNYGEVTKHPDPTKWQNGNTAGAICPVPGTTLGQGSLGYDEPCCHPCGYYTFAVDPATIREDACQISDTILFDCPANNFEQAGIPCPEVPTVGWKDSTGNYTDWGQAFCWQVTVDIAASRLLQQANAAAALAAENNFIIQQGGTPPAPYTSPQAGWFPTNAMAGNIPSNVANALYGGTYLCSDSTASSDPTFALCFLDLIKPAHTTLNVKVIQP